MESGDPRHGISTTLSIILLLSFVRGGFATISVVAAGTNVTVVSIEENGIETAIAYQLQGHIIFSNPPNACQRPVPPPTTNTSFPILQPGKVNKWILLATLSSSAGDCSLSRKAKNAQAAGYSGIIIQHVGSNDTDGALPGFIGLEWVGVKVYTCVVGDYDGETLKNFTNTGAYHVKFENEPAFNLGFLGNITIIIIFGLVGLCICVRGICFCYSKILKGVEERRRKRRILLTISELGKLPVIRWVPELPQETCTICLENFMFKDQVRMLPCSHVFHVDCLDPWLQNNRKCPNCKRRVLFLREDFSDSDNSSSTEDENEPLLRDTPEHSRFIQTLTESHNQRHSHICSCSPSTTQHSCSVSPSTNTDDDSETQQCIQGPAQNITISDVSVHSNSDYSKNTQSSTPASSDFSVSLEEVEQIKILDKNTTREEDLMGNSYATSGTNDESLSFHSCQEGTDHEDLTSSMEQRI